MFYNSFDWKKELSTQARKLKLLKHKYWFNSISHKVDRAILLSAIIIRKLIESDKLSNSADEYKLQAYTYAPRRHVDKLHRWVEDGDYEWGEHKKVLIPAKDICNSIIHSYTYSLYFTESRKLVGFFVSSDFDRNKLLYEVDFDSWIKYLEYIANDDVIAIDLHFNEKKDDYISSKKEENFEYRKMLN
jgi:hypothetical protein